MASTTLSQIQTGPDTQYLLERGLGQKKKKNPWKLTFAPPFTDTLAELESPSS